MRKILFVLSLVLAGVLFASSDVMAQAKVVTAKGIVVDENNEPIPGASVRLKEDPRLGVATNLDGAFSMSGIIVGETLVISFPGYKPQNKIVPAGDKYNNADCGTIKLVPGTQQ